MSNALPRFLRYWFTFESAVDRRSYLLHGVALMATKYAVDTAIIALVAGVIWTPIDYLETGLSFAHSKLRGGPGYLIPILALWTLPFVWIGLTMSIRRALDAGYSAWLALLFFVPLVGYAFMLVMSVLPSAPARWSRERPRPNEARLPSALLAIAAGMGLGLGILALNVYVLRSYSASLFVGMPFVVGAVTAYLFNRRYAASARETAEVVALTLAATGGALIGIAAEGAICLAMAFPLAFGVSLLGALAGRAIALRDSRGPTHALFAIALLPASELLPIRTPSPLREVRSAVEIDAPPEAVWDRVIAFPPLPEPTDLVFRLGIAYPRSARIEGRSRGAVRYCEFSTGAFVEPVTRWEPGRRLAFDITEHPVPLREWSPYASLAPPHLDGYFRARRGEFRLLDLPGGRTRLEGSTWYEMRIQPGAYWSIFADWMVGRIHDRVLEHIRRVSEGER
jgi:uncharacterized membrane protein YhaH (DUF805 family)